MGLLKALGLTICTMVLTYFVIAMYQSTDTYKANRIQDAKKLKIRETPHAIRAADGCTVYEFEKDGSTHFFTRCALRTNTIRSYQEQCGPSLKTRCNKTEEIITENSK
jgi:hypothetical protein